MNRLHLNAMLAPCIVLILAHSLPACDVFVVQGNATADGSVILVGLYQWGDIPNQPYPIQHVDRQVHPPGDVVQLSFRTVPQVRQTWAYNYVHCRYRPEDKAVPSVTHAVNEWGVAIASNSLMEGNVAGSEEDGIDFFDINRLVAERATTADEAVNLMGHWIEEYGYPLEAKDDDDGQLWVVADPIEAWVVECAGGHHWVARRIREDFFNGSNAPTIGEDFDRGSKVKRYALDEGWIEQTQDFNWKQQFLGKCSGWEHRYDAIRDYMTAADRLGRITPQTIRAMLRSEEVGKRRGIRSTQSAMIAYLRKDAPASLQAMCWLATRPPCRGGLFLPLYARDGLELPEALAGPECRFWRESRTKVSPERMDEFDAWTELQLTELESRLTSETSQNDSNAAHELLQGWHQRVVSRASEVYSESATDLVEAEEASPN